MFLAAARQRPEFALLFTRCCRAWPQLFAEVDGTRRSSRASISPPSTKTLQAFLVVLRELLQPFGRVWQPYVQARATPHPGREQSASSTCATEMESRCPCPRWSRMRQVNGPEFTVRFNEHRAAQINGPLRPLHTQQGMRGAGGGLRADDAPRHAVSTIWGMSFRKRWRRRPSRGRRLRVLAAGGFLLLRPSMRRWTLPFGVLLGTPIAVFGGSRRSGSAVSTSTSFPRSPDHGESARGQERHPHRVSFPRRVRGAGTSLFEAALAGHGSGSAHTHDRVRFHLRLLPLVVSEGAGAPLAPDPGHDGHRDARATLIAIFIIPVTFYVSERLGRKTPRGGRASGAPAPIHGGAGEDPSPGHPWRLDTSRWLVAGMVMAALLAGCAMRAELQAARGGRAPDVPWAGGGGGRFVSPTCPGGRCSRTRS